MPRPTATQLIKEIEEELDKVKTDVVSLGYEMKILQDKAKQLEVTLKDMKTEAVPRVEYNLLRTIVFGLTGLILMGVVTALVGQVVIA